MSGHIDDNAFALQVADFFKAKGDPFYGVEVKPGQPFPLVLLWDDAAQVTRVIACTVDGSELVKATSWAAMMAAFEERDGNAPCGAVAAAVCPNAWRKI
jgi:hypothetical protein